MGGRADISEDDKDQTVANLRMGKHLEYENEILAIFDMADEITKKKAQSKFFFSETEASTTATSPTTASTTTTTTSEAPLDEESSNIKESIKQVVQKVVDSMKDVVDTIKSKPLSVSSIKSIFAGIIDGVKKTLNDAGIPLPNAEPEASTEGP